jgi:hypothetical protein
MEIQDIIQGLTQTEINAITSPDERSLIVNTTLNQAVIYVNGTFKQSSFENTDDIPEGTNKFATSADLSAITANTAKVSFPEAPNDGKQYARKDLGWEEVAASGTSQPLPIIALTSTDNSSTFTEASPLIISWDVESEKDTGFTHSNSTNNSRITVSDNSTYQFGGALRIFNNSDQRIQPLPKLRIDGVVQDIAVDSGYIRNSGSASDYWSLEFTFRPLKLTANQYVEIQIGLESSNPVTFDGTLIGDESNFWGVKLQGTKGEKGDTGTGSNIIVQENDSTVGTVTDELNFEGFKSVTDEGSNKTTVINNQYYHLKDTNTSGGTIDAAFDSLLECVPSSGTLEVTVPVTGVYIIGGKVDIGTDLNKDNGSIQLMYGINGTMGALSDARQNQHAKKNKSNGVQGTWGDVSLTAGDTITLFLSTLDDSASWDNGDIWIVTWG